LVCYRLQGRHYIYFTRKTFEYENPFHSTHILHGLTNGSTSQDTKSIQSSRYSTGRKLTTDQISIQKKIEKISSWSQQSWPKSQIKIWEDCQCVLTTQRSLKKKNVRSNRRLRSLRSTSTTSWIRRLPRWIWIWWGNRYWRIEETRILWWKSRRTWASRTSATRRT